MNDLLSPGYILIGIINIAYTFLSSTLKLEQFKELSNFWGLADAVSQNL